MTYRLIWKEEIIEEGIKDLFEAEYLHTEYCLSFKDDNIRIEKEQNHEDEA